MKKVLVATEKPFAPAAVTQIKEVLDKAGYELVLLEKYTDKADLLKAVEDVDALIVRSDKVTKEVIDAAKNLKIVVRAGAGYDNIDLDACSAKNIVAMNTPGQNSNAVAELALGMMVSIARGNYNGKPGTELRGKKLGIHAYGNVGRYVAEIAKGFGMDIYAFDPFVDKAKMENEGIKPLHSVEELYSTCQYVSIHIPANDKTKKSIGYDLLSKMPFNILGKFFIFFKQLLDFIFSKNPVTRIVSIKNSFNRFCFGYSNKFNMRWNFFFYKMLNIFCNTHIKNF